MGLALRLLVELANKINGLFGQMHCKVGMLEMGMDELWIIKEGINTRNPLEKGGGGGMEDRN